MFKNSKKIELVMRCIGWVILVVSLIAVVTGVPYVVSLYMFVISSERNMIVTLIAVAVVLTILSIYLECKHSKRD